MAVAVQSLEGSEGAIVAALSLGAQAQVGAEPGLFFLREGSGKSPWWWWPPMHSQNSRSMRRTRNSSHQASANS